jgi:hypothetical protein
MTSLIGVLECAENRVGGARWRAGGGATRRRVAKVRQLVPQVTPGESQEPATGRTDLSSVRVAGKSADGHAYWAGFDCSRDPKPRADGSHDRLAGRLSPLAPVLARLDGAGVILL